MIKIGDFARLSQVTIAALRHYDEIGLLKPVEVDSFTGYRYYSVSQLPRLNRILALKDLGFSLDQIEGVMNGGITLDELRGMLKLKQAEAEQQLAQEQARLARIAARLRQIELEDTMPDYEVVLKTIPSMLIASRTATIPTNDQAPTYIDSGFSQVFDHIKRQGAKEAGPQFALWHQASDVMVNEVMETAVPIDRAVTGSDAVKVYELPQTQVASVVHHGDLENFSQSHIALAKWVEANVYRIVGPYREIYINHDWNNMSEAATEVQFPVEKG